MRASHAQTRALKLQHHAFFKLGIVSFRRRKLACELQTRMGSDPNIFFRVELLSHNYLSAISVFSVVIRSTPFGKRIVDCLRLAYEVCGFLFGFEFVAKFYNDGAGRAQLPDGLSCLFEFIQASSLA